MTTNEAAAVTISPHLNEGPDMRRSLFGAALFVCAVAVAAIGSKKKRS
jgi:hypothetical protein